MEHCYNVFYFVGVLFIRVNACPIFLVIIDVGIIKKLSCLFYWIARCFWYITLACFKTTSNNRIHVVNVAAKTKMKFKPTPG